MKDLVVGQDEELIRLHASSRYLDHLLRRQDTSTALTETSAAPSKTADPLFDAVKDHQYTTTSKTDTTRKPYKEQGVKIRVG